jgi:predicted TIM-barrel fold metal-dependent hydrolase
MGDPIHANATPEQFRFENDQVLESLKGHHDRAFGFVYLNPNFVSESLQEFDRCVRDGPMVGVKLWVGARANQPELDPIIERAASHKAVIFQHTWIKTYGNQTGESTPMDLVELARRHPKVPMICGHTGGNWELALRAIRGTPTLSADLAGSDPTSGYTEMGVRELGAERVIYGSDPGIRSFASQLAKVFGANIPERAKALILGENLRNMMLPILKAKGIKA